MTGEEAIAYGNRVIKLGLNDETEESCKMAIKALEQEPETDYKNFCEWVASEIFTEDWEYNKDTFAEIACRKLSKLGIVVSEGDSWKLKESEGKG